MKTNLILLLSLLSLSLASFITIKQEKKSVEAVYDGHEEYGYNFIVHDDEGDFDYTMTFQNVSESILKEHKLNSEDAIGDNFEVTYSSEIEVYKDEDGYENENEILTILALKKM